MSTTQQTDNSIETWGKVHIKLDTIADKLIHLSGKTSASLAVEEHWREFAPLLLGDITPNGAALLLDWIRRLEKL